VDARREHLRAVLRRRRRARLLALCVGTALVCGLVAGLVAPEILIGGVRLRAAPAAKPAADEPGPDSASLLLPLSDRLELDPREAHANALRWATMSEAERRAYFERYWQLTECGAEERQQILDRYRGFRRLPKERREFLIDRARELEEFVASLSPQDQAMLQGMADRDRAERILELWRSRYGTW